TDGTWPTLYIFDRNLDPRPTGECSVLGRTDRRRTRRLVYTLDRVRLSTGVAGEALGSLYRAAGMGTNVPVKRGVLVLLQVPAGMGTRPPPWEKGLPESSPVDSPRKSEEKALTRPRGSPMAKGHWPRRLVLATLSLARDLRCESQASLVW